jgi:hypothetical protein
MGVYSEELDIFLALMGLHGSQKFNFAAKQLAV